MIVQIGILACGLRALCRFAVGLGKGVHGAFRLDRVENFVRAFQRYRNLSAGGVV
jgi:hypothetical protein